MQNVRGFEPPTGRDNNRQPGKRHRSGMGLDSEHVHRPVRKIRKLLKKLPKQPSSEQVHQLRTNFRRLETILASLSLDRQEHQMLKRLARLRRKAGGVRDMDVLIGYVPTVQTDSEQTCTVRLLEHLGDRRRKEAKKLHAITTKKGQQVRSALKRVDRRLEKALCEKQEKSCDPVPARSQAAASALALESALALPHRLNRQNLHPYRIRVKKLQNVLRLGEGSSDREFLKALSHVKDAIGEWHDWEALQAVALEVLNHGAKCEIIRQIRNSCAEKYDTALSEAHKMRRRYVDVSSAKRNGGLKTPTTTPVWEATAAMAA
jgi:CHAD domain-containing protein